MLHANAHLTRAGRLPCCSLSVWILARRSLRWPARCGCLGHGREVVAPPSEFGEDGLADRSVRPHSSPWGTAARVQARICLAEAFHDARAGVGVGANGHSGVDGVADCVPSWPEPPVLDRPPDGAGDPRHERSAPASVDPRRPDSPHFRRTVLTSCLLRLPHCTIRALADHLRVLPIDRLIRRILTCKQ